MLWVGPGSLIFRGRTIVAGRPVPDGLSEERIAHFIKSGQIEKPKAEKIIEPKSRKRGKK
jgi:hypothetical protein